MASVSHRSYPDLTSTDSDTVAPGTGVDDTDLVQAALSAAPAGGIVRLTAGSVYAVNELTLAADGITLEGQGATLRRIGVVSNSAVLRVLGDNITVQNLRLEAGGVGGQYLVRVNTDTPTAPVARCRLVNITGICDHRTARGIFVGYYDGVTIADCYLENLLAEADVTDVNTFGITLHAGDSQFSKDAKVRHNTVKGFYDGIESFGTGLRQQSAIEHNTVTDCTNVGIYNYRAPQARVAGNHVESCVGGIFADSSNAADSSTNSRGNVLSNNVVRLCTTFGILTEEHIGASITGNTCTENQDGMVLGGGTSDATIAGNNCSYNTRYGIWVDKSLNPVQGHQYDLVLTGNVCKLNGEDGIRLGGVKRSCRVTDNTLVDNGTIAADAATSTHAGLHIGLAADAATTGVVIATDNTFGNHINGNPSTGLIGKQGYGIFIESGGTTSLVIARDNVFDNCGQFNISSGGAPVDLAGNVYRDGANSLGASVVSAYTFEGQVLLPNGTLAAPALAFAVDTGTGIRRSSASTVQHVAGGADIVQVNAGGLQATGPLVINDRLRITPESIKTSNYAVTNTDTVVIMDGTTLTATLPASPATNQFVFVRNQNAGSTLTVARNAQNINGAAADLTVAASTAVRLLHVTGSGWYVV